MAIEIKIKIVLILAVGLLSVACADFKGIFDEQALSSRGVMPPDRLNKDASREAVSTAGSTSEVREPITTKEGTYYFVREGDSLAKIAQQYRIDWEAIAQINSLYDQQLVVGRRIFIPHKKNLAKFGVVPRAIAASRKKIKQQPKHLSAKSKGPLNFAWPVDRGEITSRFGTRRGRPHDAIDIGAKVGTAVMAAEQGRVIFSKRFAGYGNLIVIKHKDDFFTAYAHNHDMFVRKGQKVRRGQRIAIVGRTGRATGPHLHFEVHKGTQAIDPLQFFPDKKW